MKRIVLTLLAATVAIAPVATLAARGGNANAGGQSASHMSSQGLANSNGPNSADRDKGLGRAEDRRSVQGATHQKATTHASKHRNSKKSTAAG